MAFDPAELERLKAGGVMLQKDSDLFTIRLRLAGGRVTSSQLRFLADLAEELGSGQVHLTVRQGVEIVDIPYENIETLRERLGSIGIQFGVCGPRVRTVTACAAPRCRYTLIPANDLGQEIDQRYYGVGGIPHKFKFAVAGCANACTKPLENDIGIHGVCETVLDLSLCDGCGTCAQRCPTKCIVVEKTNGSVRVERNMDECIRCGICADVCGKGAWQKSQIGYAVTVGGKMGKVPTLGYRAFPFVARWEDVLDICDKTLEFYGRHGLRDERFRDTLDRVGLDRFLEEVTPEGLR